MPRVQVVLIVIFCLILLVRFSASLQPQAGCKLCPNLPHPGTRDNGVKNGLFRFDIVISHCKTSLKWLQDELRLLDPRAMLSTIHIYSKCGVEPSGIEGLEHSVILRSLGNVGRCDHTYSHHIAEHYKSLPDVVLFIKDSYKEYLTSELQRYLRPISEVFDDLKDHSFACALRPVFDLSIWYAREELWKFRLPYYVSAEEYRRLAPYERRKQAGVDATWRKPKPPSMCAFIKGALDENELRALVGRQLVPVCYGGVFLVQRSMIWQYQQDTWRNFEGALSRANSIEEGHFMERLWATLLTPKLSSTHEEQILSTSAKMSTYGDLLGESYLGSLKKCQYCKNQKDVLAIRNSEQTRLLSYDNDDRKLPQGVVIVSHWMQADGAPTYALILGTQFVRMGYRVTVVSHETGEITKHFHQAHIDTIVMPELQGWNISIPTFLQTLKSRHRLQPIYVVWNTVMWAPMLKNHNRYVPNQPRMIWILHEFDLVKETALNGVHWGQNVPELEGQIGRKKVTGNLDAVVFVSERQRSLWVDSDLGNMHTLPGYPLLRNISTGVTRSSLGIPVDAFVVSAVGTYCKHKRQQWMLDALEALLRRGIDAWLLLIGKPSEYGGRGEPEYASLIETLTAQVPLKERVLLIPFGPNNHQYVRLADLHISASSHESYPLNTLEAMAMAIPVVATDAGGTGEQFLSQNTRQLLVTDVNSRVDFVQRVLYANHLHHQGLLRPLGSEFRDDVMKYADEEFGERLQQIVNQVQTQTSEWTECGLWDVSLIGPRVGQQCDKCNTSQEIDPKLIQLKAKKLRNRLKSLRKRG